MKRGDAAALAAILLGGAAFRVFFWYGLVNVDPYAYADAAASIARGQAVFDPEVVGDLYYTQYLRLSLILPAGVMFWLFGPGTLQAVLFPLVLSLGSCVVAYLMARKVTPDQSAALIAAFIVACFPLAVINSTQFLPDTVMTFFSGATVLAFWHGLDIRRQGWKTRAAIFASCGALWALAFYSRQTAAGLAIPLAALTIQRRNFDPSILFGIPGALAVATGMTILLVSLGGDPFEDIRTVISEGRGSQPGALQYTDLDLSYARTFARDEMFLPLTGLALLATALIALSWKSAPPPQRRALTTLVIVIAGQYLYFEFFMRLPSLYSWWKEPRYVLPMLIPVAAWVGVGLVRWRVLANGRERMAMVYVVAVLGFMFAFSFQSVRADHSFWETNRIDGVARELADVLKDRPEPVVFIWNDDLARYTGFQIGLDRTSYLERAKGTGYLRNRFDADGQSLVEPNSLVVTTAGQSRWSLPTAVAPHWELLWSHSSGVALWAVPAEPPPVPVQDVEIALDGGLRITGVGLSRTTALPQEHLVATLRFEGPARLVRLGTACGEQVHWSRELAPTASISVDLPVHQNPATGTATCDVVIAAGNGALALAPLDVATRRVLEPEEGYSHDPELERANATGWYRHDQPYLSGGGSVVAIEPAGPLKLEFDPVDAGELWLDLALYDYADGGHNTIHIDAGGRGIDVEWGGSPGPGVVHRTVRLDQPGSVDHLTVTVVRKGQAAVVVDNIVVSTAGSP